MQNVHGRHRARLPARDRRPATGGRPDAEGRSGDGRAADPMRRPTTTRHVRRRTASRSGRRTKRRGRRSSSSSSTPDCSRSRWTWTRRTRTTTCRSERRRVGLAAAASATPTAARSPSRRSPRSMLDVAAGELVAIVGPSGCGKSTLLRILAGLTVPTRGTASVGDVVANGHPGLVAYQPQRDLLMPWRRVLGERDARCRGRGRTAGRGAAARRPRASTRFGLDGFDRAWPAALSGGMRQRVALAAHVPRAASRAAARRAARRARRDHAAHHAGVAAGGLDGRRAHGRARHPRRRGGAAPRRSRAS